MWNDSRTPTDSDRRNRVAPRKDDSWPKNWRLRSCVDLPFRGEGHHHSGGCCSLLLWWFLDLQDELWMSVVWFPPGKSSIWGNLKGKGGDRPSHRKKSMGFDPKAGHAMPRICMATPWATCRVKAWVLTWYETALPGSLLQSKSAMRFSRPTTSKITS